MSVDPFLIVKDEVIKSIAVAEKQLKKVKFSHGDNKNINELSTTLKSISLDLEDLEETVSIVEKDPEKFPVAFKELASRKIFVEQTNNKLNALKAKLNDITNDKFQVKIGKSNVRY